LRHNKALQATAAALQFCGFVGESLLPASSVRSFRRLFLSSGDTILNFPESGMVSPELPWKRKMHSTQNLLFGLTNDAFGYILTKVDFHSFPRYDYISRTSLGELTGEILIDQALEFIKKSPTPDH